MSGCGYKQKYHRPLSYTRYTPNSRRRRGQGPLSRVTSAVPSSAGGQDDGAVRPHLTHFGLPRHQALLRHARLP